MIGRGCTGIALAVGLVCVARLAGAAKAPARDPLAEAKVLAARADSVLASGRLYDRAALDPAERAWRLRESALPVGHPDRLASLDQLARLHAERDSLALAARFAEQQRGEVLGPSPRDTVRWARSLARLAMVASREGRGAASTAQLDSALALLDAVAVRDTSLWAMLLNARGSEAISLDQYLRAEADLALALQLRRATQGESSAEIAMLLNNQGNLAGRQGDVREALRLHRLALEMRRATLGRDHPDVALSLGTIATDENTLGRYVEARDHATEALVLIERALGPESSRMVRPLNTLINSLGLLRDLPGALEQSQRLQRITLASTPPGSVARALPYRQLALAYARLQRHAEAQTQLDSARAIVERTVGAQSLEMAGVLWRQVNISEARQDTAGIVKAMREARAIYQKLGVDEASETHGVTLRLALFDQRRDTSEVFRDFRDGIAGMTRVLTEQNPEVATGHRDYAIALMRQGRTAEAFREAAICDRIQRTHFLGLVRSLGENEALLYSRQRLNGVHLMTWAASRGNDPAQHRLAYDATVRSRLLLFDELAARRQLSSSPGTRAAELEREVGRVNSSLTRLVQRGAAGESRETYDRRLSAMRTSRDSLRALLLASAPVAGRVYAGAEAGLDSVLASRGQDVALVSYATVRVPTATGDLRFYGAFVVPPRSRQPMFVRLANADTLERSVRAWLEELGQNGDRSQSGWRVRARQLHGTLWAPLAARLRGAREIVVVPDGLLAQLPFHLLSDAKGKLLLESGPLLRLRGNERDLIGDALPGKSGKGLLAMGAPDFDSRAQDATASTAEPSGLLRDACVRAGEYRFAALPGAAAEIRDVAAAWRARHAAGDSVCTRSGADASESEFRLLAPGQRVLHLATHGFFLDERCSAAAGARGIGGLAPSSAASTQRATGSPLLRCGLVLAGANRLAESSGDPRDGWLTAEEVAGMDLSGVDCAVLSACETAGGSIEITEGLVGLERAFRIAGVKSLVTSCWAVDDQATREWMAEFHRAFDREQGDTARAVRATSLAVRAARLARGESDAPFYWAPFVATGR